ncbi:MAG TPA: NAD(P)/FAD-dependent oxidoreductase [Acidobacteriota bacterium]|nr:NAD(P)/FAD-dependent oxidoreductase [Acidobacteriota bacterium]
MRVGIIGARVAGSYAGVLFSRMGHEVLLFDDSIEKDKPCGGGVTAKALRRMPWLCQQSLPYTEARTIHLTTSDGYTSRLPLPHPVHIFPRFSLDRYLLDWAIQSGVRFFPERARKIESDGKTWSIATSGGTHEVDYLIGADGARSKVRATVTRPFCSSDLILALGYQLPQLYHPGEMRVAYQEIGFYGYIWSFPCVDHSSIGIGRHLPGIHSSDLKRRLENYISSNYPDAGQGKNFYAACIPCLSRDTLMNQKVCGERWALLGDAAGFTDGITAEGIYYAFRSAELLADSCRRREPLAYEAAWRSEFSDDLETAAAWRDRFYCGMVLSKTFIRRSLQAVKHSPTIRHMLDRVISGNLSYKALLQNLVYKSPQILAQVIRSKSRRITNYELQITN